MGKPRLILPGKFVCEYDDPQVLYVIHEIFYLGIYDGIQRSDKKRVVLDCGANIGLFTIWALSKGYEKVIALEPDPRNFTQLVSNLKINNVEASVFAINSAAWSTSGTVRLRQGGAWSSVITSQQENGETISVPTITLDDLSAKLGCRFDAIKIDVEEAEYEVLKGGERALDSCSTIIIEYHSTRLLEECSRFLGAKGFKVTNLSHYRFWLKGYILLNLRQCGGKVTPDILRRVASLFHRGSREVIETPRVQSSATCWRQRNDVSATRDTCPFFIGTCFQAICYRKCNTSVAM